MIKTLNITIVLFLTLSLSAQTALAGASGAVRFLQALWSTAHHSEDIAMRYVPWGHENQLTNQRLLKLSGVDYGIDGTGDAGSALARREPNPTNLQAWILTDSRFRLQVARSLQAEGMKVRFLRGEYDFLDLPFDFAGTRYIPMPHFPDGLESVLEGSHAIRLLSRKKLTVVDVAHEGIRDLSSLRKIYDEVAEGSSFAMKEIVVDVDILVTRTGTGDLTSEIHINQADRIKRSEGPGSLVRLPHPSDPALNRGLYDIDIEDVGVSFFDDEIALIAKTSGRATVSPGFPDIVKVVRYKGEKDVYVPGFKIIFQDANGIVPLGRIGEETYFDFLKRFAMYMGLSV